MEYFAVSAGTVYGPWTALGVGLTLQPNRTLILPKTKEYVGKQDETNGQCSHMLRRSVLPAAKSAGVHPM